MNEQEFKYTIDSMQLLAKYEGANEMYVNILCTLASNLSHRQIKKLIPKLIEAKTTYMNKVEKQIVANKAEKEFMEKVND